MSLLKWKEMADKRSELGKKINTVRETIKQKTISDQMGAAEAEKLFKPITSGLRDITAPKIQFGRLPNKKRPMPDYGLQIGDDEEVPDFHLEDLFGKQVQPQNDKQLVPKPPSYEDILKDLANDENLEYEPEDPPEYEEEEGPDYAIIEGDQINQVLDTLKIPNYEDVEYRLDQEGMNSQKRKSYLNKILKKAKSERAKLTGYSTQVTKKINSGSISEAEAQYRKKTISDTRKVLDDYIAYNNQKLKNIKGSGLKKGGQIMFFNNPTEMMKKLELIIGSMTAGNNSTELRNTGVLFSTSC